MPMRSMFPVMMALLVVVCHAATAQVHKPKSEQATAAQLVADLRALPPYGEVGSEEWKEYLRRCREMSPVALAALANTIRFDQDGTVRRRAAMVLTLLGNGQGDERGGHKVSLLPILDAMSVALGDEHADTRATAAMVLGMTGAAAAPYVTRLSGVLADEDRATRDSAADALGLMGAVAKDAVPALQRLYNTSGHDPAIQRTVQDALVSIGGMEAAVTNPPPGGILLLAGYKHVTGLGIDTQVGRIWRTGGPQIHYSIGFMADDRASFIIEEASKIPYLWSKMQVVGGHSVRVTMLTRSRLTATFQKDFANFDVTDIRSAEDLADVLLMLATYTPPMP